MIGSDIVPKDATLMTICNSTAAIMVIKESHLAKRVKRVFSLETRPRRQGLITVSELAKASVPVTLTIDNAARYFLPEVDIVLTGADSVLADGRVANKIGTAQLASMAKELGIPIYTCAETYKFHPGTLKGEELFIEERSPDEVWMGEAIPRVDVRNPAFDIVAPDNITGIITEKGVIEPSSVIDDAKPSIKCKFQ